MRIRLAALAVVVFTVGGRVALADMGPHTGPAARKGVATKRFSGYGIRFRYPVSLRAYRYQHSSSFSSSIVYLSNVRLHNPCVARRSATSAHISCTTPTRHLPPKSVLIEWSENGSPGWTFSRAHGTRTRIGGRPAKTSISRDTCGVDANVLVDAIISIPSASDDWDEMRACIRGPHVKVLERVADRILDSVTFSK